LQQLPSNLATGSKEKLQGLLRQLNRVFQEAAERLRLFAADSRAGKSKGTSASKAKTDVDTANPNPRSPDDDPNLKKTPANDSTAAKNLLPTSNGKWDGPSGESGWISDKPEILAITKGEPIPFTNQRPDFSKWSVDDIVMEPGELNGDHPHDRRAAIKKFIQRGKWKNMDEAIEWLNERSLAIHHAENNKIEMIPLELNKLTHTGAAADFRRQK
jgi:hypothetical protein